MAGEAETQKQLITFLKSKGCYVIKTKPGPGTPVGCPDVLALHEGFWGAFECKGSEKARFQPLQKETLAKLNDWSYATVVHPGNFEQIVAELDRMLTF